MKRFGWVAALAVVAGCATEENVNFGDPARVVGGFFQSTATGPPCTPDFGCSVSWATDIYAPLLAGKAKCGDALCHEQETGGFTFSPTDAAAAYASLTDFTLAGEGAYIVPCDPDASTMLCNLSVDVGSNPFGGCGSPMPKMLASAAALSPNELDLIATWIQCGAPDN